ncbi:uncharacterized protein F4817DRAFT_332214 [Daldinia loculata]|uniref:uncharacterized protein n=1 Tax=Daldinia loculata TaxID=103429 RepID=UPI0020C435A5|nr:uncharacterized protein F4817DRAFT_332214 [Daldinia loculata]KAI1649241.1 hypothetical protein F4817DRAFT_332214 [Daldinia loculata]
MSDKPAYAALSAEPDSEPEMPLLSYHDSVCEDKKSKVLRRIHWVIHGFSVIGMLVLFISLYLATQINQGKCWSMFNYYSPVNDAVTPHPYVHRVFNGSLWHQSRWKGPPTEEVEQAWYDIMRYGMISVSKEDILKVQHPDWSAQFPSEAGGGYIAATIGTHQLHCLHYIWQDHYIDYFPKTQDKKQRVPEMYERHYEHCVDYIRQSLMCQFDTGIIPYNWVLDHENPTPNANTHHKCVDWDALQAWFEKRRVQVPEGFEWRQPENAVSMDWNP